MPYEAGSSAQRIRIGLTGLAFAFLLVLLGLDHQPVEPRQRRRRGEPSVTAADEEPTEPLAELGVAPGAGEQANNVLNSKQS